MDAAITFPQSLVQARGHNFCAGPGVLPLPVIEAIRDELPALPGVGASVFEISHRSDAYTEIAASARARLQRLLGLGDEWLVLFLQGGASMQFHQVPLNFLAPGQSADYVVTGVWAEKALKEARLLGEARIAASGEASGYRALPSAESWEVDPEAAYLHMTSNNTIYGTEYRTDPSVPVPIVSDASSDFLSRPIDLDPYGLIYAGAQKNIGPAGVVVVLVRDEFLQTRRAGLPTLLDYGTHAARLFHTPPVFAVYVVEKVLGWLEEEGGLAGIAERNERKAGRLYDRLDASGFYHPFAEKASRSLMNVTFRLATEELEERFASEAEASGLLALAGHRSAGGLRASLYNALPEEAVSALVAFMDDFEARYG